MDGCRCLFVYHSLTAAEKRRICAKGRVGVSIIHAYAAFCLWVIGLRRAEGMARAVRFRAARAMLPPVGAGAAKEVVAFIAAALDAGRVPAARAAAAKVAGAEEDGSGGWKHGESLRVMYSLRSVWFRRYPDFALRVPERICSIAAPED